jgi:hypothetical protein
MSESHLVWLLKCAAELNSNIDGRVPIESFYDRFNIGIDIKCDPTIRKNTGVLMKTPLGRFRVVLIRPYKSSKLSPRDRFTLAHELGHILLYEQFGWNPSKDMRKKYYDCEDDCDNFSQSLLVPDRAVVDLKLGNAILAHQCLLSLSVKYDVSFEVIARRIIKFHSNIGFLRGGNHINAAGKEVIKLSWGHSSLKELNLKQRHLKEEELLGRALLAKANLIPMDERELKEIEIPNIGFASGHRLRHKAGNHSAEFVLSIIQPTIKPKQLEML